VGVDTVDSGTGTWDCSRLDKEDTDTGLLLVLVATNGGGCDRWAVMACIKLTGGRDIAVAWDTWRRGTVGRLGGADDGRLGVLATRGELRRGAKFGRFCLA